MWYEEYPVDRALVEGLILKAIITLGKISSRAFWFFSNELSNDLVTVELIRSDATLLWGWYEPVTCLVTWNILHRIYMIFQITFWPISQTNVCGTPYLSLILLYVWKIRANVLLIFQFWSFCSTIRLSRSSRSEKESF